MAEYPYVMVIGKLKEFIERHQSLGIPSKVTIQYMKSVGFNSSNDTKIIPTLKYLEFLDSNGVPTDLWKAYRDKKKAPSLMAGAVRAAYASLYSTFPDAHRSDNEALHNFFGANTNLSGKTIEAVVGTFKALVELSDFETEPSQELAREEPNLNGNGAIRKEELELSRLGLKMSGYGEGGVSVNINIAIGVPETTDPEVYENFFKSLKRHLLTP